MTRRRTVVALTTVSLIALGQVSSEAQFGFGGAGSRREIVAQFDRDGDGYLNAAERQAAREALGLSGTRRGGRQGFAGAPVPGPRLLPADVRPPFPTTPLYDLGTLRTIFLQFEQDDWEEELEAFHDTDVEVPATMTVDGRRYPDVGVRFRGASSYRRVSPGYKRPLNLSIDHVHNGQNLRGYRTLNLHNSNNDPTFLRTVLYAEIARHYLPIAKVNLVRVVINGESWGIYVNSQQFNNDFVEEWFGLRRGARWRAPGSPGGRAGLEYLGDNPARYRQLFEIRSRDDAESWAALIEMTRVLNETPSDRLEAALSPLLDIDGALKFLALEVALVNSDGYWSRASDYNLYRHPKGRFHVIPHDFNEALGFGGGFGRGGPELDPLIGLSDPGKPLRSKLLAVPVLRQRYLGYVRDIAENWLDWNRLGPIVEAGHRLIAADVKTDTRKLSDYASFEAVVSVTNNPLRAFIERRRAYLLEYTPPRPGATSPTSGR